MVRLVFTMAVPAAMLGANVALGGSIYKCKDAQGNTIFSQSRCGDAVSEMELDPVTPMYKGVPEARAMLISGVQTD